MYLHNFYYVLRIFASHKKSFHRLCDILCESMRSMFVSKSKEFSLVAQSLRYMKFGDKIFFAVLFVRLSLIGLNCDNINLVRLLDQWNQANHSTARAHV